MDSLVVFRPLAQIALLLTVAAACARPGEPTAEAQPTARWTARSTTERIVAALQPENGPYQIGPLQSWVLQLRHADSEQPVYPARIGVNGGMPEHGHGLPTQPQVTEYLQDGRYRIEGMKFNMAGKWVLLFVIDTPDGKDRVQFEVELEW